MLLGCYLVTGYFFYLHSTRHTWNVAGIAYQAAGYLLLLPLVFFVKREWAKWLFVIPLYPPARMVFDLLMEPHNSMLKGFFYFGFVMFGLPCILLSILHWFALNGTAPLKQSDDLK